MKVKQYFLRFGTFKINNGAQVRFWEDTWLGSQPLKVQYPGLYSIVRKKFVTIAEVLGPAEPNVSWRRSLIGNKLVAWNNIISRIANIQLSNENDEYRWNLCRNGQFSVKSHYQALIKWDVPNLNKRIWQLKAPLKIKVFLWYLRRGVILTKDNLAKRNWQGNKTCCFCHEMETIPHLFFDCRFARMVWGIIFLALGVPKPHSVSDMFGRWLGTFARNLRRMALLGAATTVWSLWMNRNDFVFENKTNFSPLQVIFAIFHWLRT